MIRVASMQPEGAMRATRFLMCGTIVAAVQASGSSARPWGDEGHEIAGLITEHYLKPDVKHKVEALLAGDTTNLIPHDTGDPIADEATWADKYRDEDSRKLHYAATQQWHFVDMEIGRPDLASARFGRAPLPAHAARPASLGMVLPGQVRRQRRERPLGLPRIQKCGI